MLARRSKVMHDFLVGQAATRGHGKPALAALAQLGAVCKRSSNT